MDNKGAKKGRFKGWLNALVFVISFCFGCYVAGYFFAEGAAKSGGLFKAIFIQDTGPTFLTQCEQEQPL